MIVLVLLFYFSLVFATVLLLIFPAQRGVAASSCRNSINALRLWIGRWVRVGARMPGAPRDALSMCVGRISGWSGRHRFTIGMAAVIIVSPSLVAFLLRGPAVFDFVDAGYAPSHQIEALLHGEHLVPPPPLPPEVFTTREVEHVRPDVMNASRNWGQLDHEFTRRLLFVVQAMRARYGYELVLLEGYRSPERQTQLAAQGSGVTQAGAYMSYHQYGLAADCAFVRNGKLIIAESDPWAMRGYVLYGELAESIGLTWGGRWQMRDFGHVELRREGTLGTPLREAKNSSPSTFDKRRS